MLAWKIGENDFCPYFLKNLANCPYFEIIEYHVSILKLDFMIIEF